jgi:hypothetical protein
MKCGLEYAEQGLPGTLKSVGTVTRGEDRRGGADFPVNCPKIRRISADIAVKQVRFFKCEGIGVPWL